MEKAGLPEISEMKKWYEAPGNTKRQEIADYVVNVAASAPLDTSRIELFTQGALFGYFLTIKGYIKA